MTATTLIVQLNQVNRIYGQDIESRASELSADAITVLDNISMHVHAGEMLAIVGPSGSGKSTLLNLIGALDRPTSGSVHIGGNDLSSMTDDELAMLRNKRIGFIFQSHHLLPQCSALENVLLPTLVERRVATPEVTERAKSLLERIGLKDRMQHRPGQLSGGECQRVAVVRALINQPMLILADEPTGALDRASTDRLADLLEELNREDGLTILTVTHSEHLAGRMQRQLRLQDGKLQSSDSTSREAAT